MSSIVVDLSTRPHFKVYQEFEKREVCFHPDPVQWIECIQALKKSGGFFIQSIDLTLIGRIFSLFKSVMSLLAFNFKKAEVFYYEWKSGLAISSIDLDSYRLECYQKVSLGSNKNTLDKGPNFQELLSECIPSIWDKIEIIFKDNDSYLREFNQFLIFFEIYEQKKVFYLLKHLPKIFLEQAASLGVGIESIKILNKNTVKGLKEAFIEEFFTKEKLDEALSKLANETMNALFFKEELSWKKKAEELFGEEGKKDLEGIIQTSMGKVMMYVMYCLLDLQLIAENKHDLVTKVNIVNYFFNS